MLDIPKHVMIVMDTNSHKSMCVNDRKSNPDNLVPIIFHAFKLGVKNLSLVDLCHELSLSESANFLVDTLHKEIYSLIKNNIKLKFTADRSFLSNQLNKTIVELEILTNENSGMILNILLNDSFNQDIVNVTKKIMLKCQDKNISIDDINESMLIDELSCYEQGDIELFIRAGGQSTLANCLVWQLAYSELYFMEKSWSDFCCHDFDLAVDWFCNRERRFGQTSEQLN